MLVEELSAQFEIPARQILTEYSDNGSEVRIPRERDDKEISWCDLWGERQNTTSFIAGVRLVDMLNQIVENTAIPKDGSITLGVFSGTSTISKLNETELPRQ